jgi:hypothetical protein
MDLKSIGFSRAGSNPANIVFCASQFKPQYSLLLDNKVYKYQQHFLLFSFRTFPSLSFFSRSSLFISSNFYEIALNSSWMPFPSLALV